MFDVLFYIVIFFLIWRSLKVIDEVSSSSFRDSCLGTVCRRRFNISPINTGYFN